MLLRDAILNEYFFASNESISMVSVFVVSIQEHVCALSALISQIETTPTKTYPTLRAIFSVI